MSQTETLDRLSKSAQSWVGHAVQFVVDGKISAWGRCEYVLGGWVGIKCADDGVTWEFPLTHVTPDPT